MDCFHSSEDDGVKQSTIDSAMFAYERLQNLDPAFVVDFSALEIENFNAGILTEPDVECFHLTWMMNIRGLSCQTHMSNTVQRIVA